MAREIKFRGKKFCQDEWIYGSLITRGERGADGNFIDTGRGECYPLQQDTIGQFTGLHDKNGKEIYEGDIVKFKEKVNYIAFHRASASFRLITANSDINLGNRGVPCETLRVIGNIYDNPELLKKD